MEFRKELITPASDLQINFSDKIMLIGSCFAESIGQKLAAHQFHVISNPHGILFNPMSISKALDDILSCKKYTHQDLRLHQGKYISMNHHGRFSSADLQETIGRINESIDQAHNFLKAARLLILTFGSSHAWKMKNENAIVANCHKIPQQEFEKVLIDHTETEGNFKTQLQRLKDFNPGLHVVLTVSPVRYYRDGIVDNNLSKSHLLIACHHLMREAGVHYLPAYEWIIDDLRDYRFFKEDMTHPNEMAIQYVWEKFIKWSMAPSVLNKIKQIGDLSRGLKHRAENPDSPDEKARIADIIAKIEGIKNS